MKAHVVTGFLGAGKTTFLRNFVPRVAGREKILILVNEFSALGIDGQALSRAGLSTIELPNGCICCTLAGSLLETLEKARAGLAADRVLIEPTGIAAPSQIHALIAQPPVNAWCEIGPTVALIDAARYRQMADGPYLFWHDQVETSDVLLLNKVDRISGPEREEILADLARRNPGARIHATLFGELPESEWRDILESTHRPARERPRREITLEAKRVECWDMACPQPLRRERIAAWLEALSAGRFGEALRAKGDLCDEAGARHLDWVPGDTRWSEPLGAETRVVVVGRNLNREGLRQGLLE